MRSAGEGKDNLKRREQKGGSLDELQWFSLILTVKSSFSRLAKFSFDAYAPDDLHHGKVRGQPMETSRRLSGGAGTQEQFNRTTWGRHVCIFNEFSSLRLSASEPSPMFAGVRLDENSCWRCAQSQSFSDVV